MYDSIISIFCYLFLLSVILIRECSLTILTLWFYWYFLCKSLYKPLLQRFVTFHVIWCYSILWIYPCSFNDVLFWTFGVLLSFCPYKLVWLQIANYSLRINSWRRTAGSDRHFWIFLYQTQIGLQIGLLFIIPPAMYAKTLFSIVLEKAGYWVFKFGSLL